MFYLLKCSEMYYSNVRWHYIISVLHEILNWVVTIWQ